MEDLEDLKGTRFNRKELELLRSEFERNRKPNRNVHEEVAKKLDRPLKKIQIWFQNERAKLKKGKKREEFEGRGRALPAKKTENFYRTSSTSSSMNKNTTSLPGPSSIRTFPSTPAQSVPSPYSVFISQKEYIDRRVAEHTLPSNQSASYHHLAALQSAFGKTEDTSTEEKEEKSEKEDKQKNESIAVDEDVKKEQKVTSSSGVLLPDPFQAPKSSPFIFPFRPWERTFIQNLKHGDESQQQEGQFSPSNYNGSNSPYATMVAQNVNMLNMSSQNANRNTRPSNQTVARNSNSIQLCQDEGRNTSTTSTPNTPLLPPLSSILPRNLMWPY